MRIYFCNKTISILKANYKDFKPRYWNEPHAKYFALNRLFVVVWNTGEDTYEQEYSDIDICNACGEHSSETIDVESGDSLGSSCCGAGTPYLD